MTDKTQDASDFSFRTFDIYRRFVEVLQHKPAYLEEFKNGSPKKETCLSIIKRVFQSEQQEEEIKKYIQYFADHAKMMAGHAEKLPDNWSDAINYTERYIKEIDNYLRDKGISIRSVLKSVDKIAGDIAKCLHDNPSVRQIEAIRYYLKHDLRNPKRNIISPNTPKKSKKKSKRPSKSLERSETVNNKIVEEQGNVYVQKENNESSTTYEAMQKAHHFLKNSNEKDSNNDKTIEPPPQFEFIETEIVVEELLVTPEQEYQIIVDTDNINNEEITLPELSPSSNCNAVKINNINEGKQIEGTGGTEQTFATRIMNASSTELKNGNDDKYPNYNFTLKRKFSDSPENDHCSLKKQLQFCRRIPHDVSRQKPNVIQSEAVRIRRVSDNSSDFEINVENDENEMQKSTFLMMNNFEVRNEIEEKTLFDSEVSEQMPNSIFNLKSQVKNMSYTTAVKYIDLVTTFCQSKNAISQEELSIMQQIRDKIYFKSLNEQSFM